VRFSWDAQKSEANLAARGFDFEFASLIFDGPTLERVDDRADYGEPRIVAVGLADGFHLTVVYTDRSSQRDVVRRIISARRSNRRERRAYDQAYHEEA
jgi:uncharacterized DUF497 family protein